MLPWSLKNVKCNSKKIKTRTLPRCKQFANKAWKVHKWGAERVGFFFFIFGLQFVGKPLLRLNQPNTDSENNHVWKPLVEAGNSMELVGYKPQLYIDIQTQSALKLNREENRSTQNQSKTYSLENEWRDSLKRSQWKSTESRLDKKTIILAALDFCKKSKSN